MVYNLDDSEDIHDPINADVRQDYGTIGGDCPGTLGVHGDPEEGKEEEKKIERGEGVRDRVLKGTPPAGGNDWPAGRGKATYVIVMITLLNAANKLSRFVLIEMIKEMAIDLEFGDRTCLNSSVTFDPETDVEARKKYACAAERCETSATMRTVNGSLASDDGAPSCYWQYWGTGLEYQLLAGPAFIVVVGLMRIPVTLIMERGRVNGCNVLIACAVAWSLATLVTAFATELWHVVICRLALGLFQSPFSPFAVAMVTAYFPPQLRGLAMSTLNSGIAIGYGLSYGMGFMREFAGWRWAYRVASLPGLIIAFVMFLTLREPSKTTQNRTSLASQDQKLRRRDLLAYLHWATIVPITLGAALRFGATYVYNYNLNNYVLHYYPHYHVHKYLSWTALVAGLGGVVWGGVLNDVARKLYGVQGRVCLQIVVSIMCAPFLISVFFVDPPLIFAMSSLGTSMSDSWTGSTVSAMSELVPAALRPSFFAVYYCIINTVGGTLNTTLPSLRRALGFRYAMLAEVMGMITLGTALHAAGFVAMTCACCSPRERTYLDLNENERKSLRERETVHGDARTPLLV